ncbi:hypothetical protein Pst134EB_016984 [Puccinia striiformis f. sp. tritici]|nr:hypothetical protein Pst134EB_016984 [Puccinia striiformis f. sp. tritici]
MRQVGPPNAASGSDENLGLSDEEVEKSVCLDPNEVLATDYSEISGSDEDTLSDMSHLDTSSITQSTQGSSPENSQKKKLSSASFFKDTKVQRLFRFSKKNMILLLTYDHYLKTAKNGNYNIGISKSHHHLRPYCHTSELQFYLLTPKV